MARIVREHDGAEQVAQALAQLREQGDGARVAVARGLGGGHAVPAAAGEELLAAEGLQRGAAVRQAAEFAGATVGSAEEASAVHDAHPDARAQGDDDEHFRLCAGRVTLVHAHRVAVGVVIDGHGPAEALLEELFERDFRPGRDIDGVIDDAPLDIHDGRDADADFFRVRCDDAGNPLRERVDGLLPGGFVGEPRAGNPLHNLPVLDQAQDQIGSSDVNSKCHLLCDFFAKLWIRLKAQKQAVQTGTICKNKYYPDISL